jgi:putrescine aminotransferase
MSDAARGESLARRLFERNVLVAHTLNKPEVIRIEPPLVITTELVDRALGAFGESLAEEDR